VNSTGIVWVDGHPFAVAILTEGHHNIGTSDERGFNPERAQVVTLVARQVLDGLRGGSQ